MIVAPLNDLARVDVPGQIDQQVTGAKVLAITNVVDSSIARESDVALYTRSGPEIGVAATKTFTSQLVLLLLVALDLGRRQNKLAQDLKYWVDNLLKLPGQVEQILKNSEEIRQIALRYQEAKNYLFIGRGPHFPIALEGALKLKEIPYLHAEGYAAGELKHGPIAMIESGTPVIAFAIKDKYYEKMLSNIQEVLSRKASVIAIASAGDAEMKHMATEVMSLPPSSELLAPILAAIPIQLFAYFIAAARGHEIDQPRNLAKSVTVE